MDFREGTEKPCDQVVSYIKMEMLAIWSPAEGLSCCKETGGELAFSEVWAKCEQLLCSCSALWTELYFNHTLIHTKKHLLTLNSVFPI